MSSCLPFPRQSMDMALAFCPPTEPFRAARRRADLGCARAGAAPGPGGDVLHAAVEPHHSGADIRRETGAFMTNSCLNVQTLSMGHTNTKPHVSHSGRSSRRRLHSPRVLITAHTAAVSFSAVARLLAREQLPRHLLHKSLLLAPQRKRSSAPDLATRL